MNSPSPARTTRLRQRLTIVVAATALAGATLATAVPATAHQTRATPWTATAQASHGKSRGTKQPATVGTRHGTVHYAVDQPACAVPKNPNLPRCFAMQRVDVSKGTAHAYRYVQPDSIGLGPAGGYTPDDLAAAYHYNPKVNRRSQLVGIVDWNDDPKALSDLDRFDKHYGLHKETKTSFRKVNQKGRTAPLPKRDKEGSVEIALDIESVRAVCHTCRILLIEADAGIDKDLAAAENLAATMGATEISNSFGETEHKVSARIRAAYNHPGVVITASTGDDGWFAWDRMNDGSPSGNAPEYPASSPDVVAVGGTELALNNNGTRYAEEVWNENGADDQAAMSKGQSLGAGGGGCSKLYAAQPWQTHYKGYSAAGCKGKRLDADISAIADPAGGLDILDSFASSTNGGWSTVGGTSLASPVVAAMYALAGGSGGSAYPAASLYVNGTHRASSLFDVTVGGNGYCAGDSTLTCGNDVDAVYGTHNPNGLVYTNTGKRVGNLDCSFSRTGADPAAPPPFSSECNAVKGFDGPSGLGAPKSDALFDPTNAKMALAHSALTVKKAAVVKAHITQRVSGTRATKLLWNFGDGRSATTKGASVHHTWARAGRYRVTLTEVDSRYQRSVVRLTVTVHQPKHK